MDKVLPQRFLPFALCLLAFVVSAALAWDSVFWRWVAAINPMTPIVEAFRLLLLGVGTVEPVHIIGSIASTTIVALVGLLLFGRVEKTFVDTI